MTGPRIAIVSGGTRGLGRLITDRLAATGISVVALWAADETSAAATAAHASERGLDVVVEQAELTDPAQAEDVVRRVLARHGRVDHLVNNAGIMRDGRLTALSVADWDRVIAVDLSAVFYLARAVYPTMVERGFGRIVTMGSTAAVAGSPARPNYAAAKAGLLGLARSIAGDGATHGITSNLIVVGPTDTGIGEVIDPAHIARLVSFMPIGRQVRGDEVVHAVEFLLDDRAAAITGSVVTVDGGFTM